MSAFNIDTALAQFQIEVNNCERALLELIQVKKMTAKKSTEISELSANLQRIPVAIIGMASIFPQARNLQDYWKNIIRKIDCITDVPPSRWDVEAYYDPDPKAPDKTYCKRGGFIPDFDFNPMDFGLPPSILEVTDISQLLGLVVAKAAMEDAGYAESEQFNRERVGVILGVALARQLTLPLAGRLQYPVWEKVLKSSGLSDAEVTVIIEKMKLAYVKWEENAFPGMLANVVAGRIANRFNFGGMNCVVDAACASSLGALAMALGELTTYRSDMMLTGGVDTDNSVLAYMCFSKTPALSRSQNVKPFDAEADGMMLGEGVGMVVLKRLQDAERDGDKIYAAIKGIGTSSDGKYKSIYAPRPEGQMRALRRAYADAGFAPTTVSLIEAHGTGTLAGDPAEFAALNAVFSENNPRTQHIALGSVKSQIGHTKATAGAASLIKTALALHHKIIPPTINVTQPNPKFNIETSPFYLSTETRPWFRQTETPRRAGVSSFGFGGTNYHVVLEEYTSEHDRPYRLHRTPQPILLFAPTPAELLTQCQAVLHQWQSQDKEQHYADLIAASKALEIPIAAARVGFVANSLTAANHLLQIGIEWLQNQPQVEAWEHPQGIYYRCRGLETAGKVVALFSGQGAQYLEMGRELALNFPCLRQTYSYMDKLLNQDGLSPLSEIVFPPPVFDPAQRKIQTAALQQTEYAQPAIGAFSVGLYQILQQAGFKPDFVAGHSFGELTALWAAEVLSEADYFFLVKARGQAMATSKQPEEAGTMLAVKGDASQIEAAVKHFPQVAIANYNSPQQVVLAGAKAEITKVQQALQAQGYSAVLLPVAAAFHTPLVAHAQQPFAQAIAAVTFKEAKVPVYTNVTGKLYPSAPAAMQTNLQTHLTSMVLFRDQIEQIYADGGSIFIEVGPKNILTNLVKQILGDRPHLAVALNPSWQKDSDRCLREAVVQLRVFGLPLKNLDPYQVEHHAATAPKQNVLNFRLGSTNYVSEKTKTAFTQALQQGQQVKPLTATSSPLKTSEEPEAPLTTTAITTNGKHQQQAASAKSLQLSSQPALPVNYQQILDSLEYSLTQFEQHQSAMLQVHEQALNHQMEYAKTFFQLMEQQNSLFGEYQPPATQAAQLPGIESIERSMTRFHDHQDETLRIHEQYLDQQMAYANNFFQWFQQQYQLLLTGISTDEQRQLTQVTVPVVDHQASTTLLATTENGSASKGVVVRATAVASSTDADSPARTTNNGSSNGSNLLQEELKVIAPPTEIEDKETKTLAVSLPLALPELAELSQTLLAVVSDKTGYPTEMLELEMDLEADLGIDSIKRVEILGALQESYSSLPQPNLEELAEQRTLGQIVSYMRSLAPEIVEAPASPEVDSSQVSLTDTEPDTTTAIAPLPSVNIDLTSLSQTLLTVVSDKTGYPVEMLELEMDLEADLGIDSIKRVEILGALLELYPELPQPNPEELAELRTLGQIVAYMRVPVAKVATKMPQQLEMQPDISHNICRSQVRLKVLPPPDSLNFTLPQNHVGLLTDDGSATTSQLAAALTAQGWQVVVLSFPAQLIARQSPLPASVSRVVLADLSEEHLQQQLAAIATKYGSIAAFIHLHPASEDNQSQAVRYLEVEKALLKQIFLIAKHLKVVLNQASEQGCSCFLTVTRLDGEFGLGQTTNFGAVGGGLFGLTKTLNQEWATVFCRAIDLSPDLDTAKSVQYILDELQDPNRLLAEVGYSRRGRTTLVAEPTPLTKTVNGSEHQINRNSVFLVSGGGKGITAECVIKLAQHYQCKFILLGRSAIATPEPSWAVGCFNEAELKQRIVTESSSQGVKLTPARVQQQFKAIVSKRQIESTLQAVAQAGGQAEYLSVDVTDAIALAAKLTPVIQRLGAVTGIIHGAGNLADKRIEKKTEQDFETVYTAKVAGLENLLRSTNISQLDHLVLFSSVAGFYGNIGQADYAIANEILNKSAHLIKCNYPNCQVSAINWGPWESGMVSPELKKAFAARNIETIPISIGTQMLVDELTLAHQVPAQVIIGSPIVSVPEVLNPDLQNFSIHRQLTLAANPFLQDHVIADYPVLPATCAMGWIANTCEQLYPGYTFFSCDNFKVLKGIIFDQNLADAYVLDLKEIAKTSFQTIEFEAKIWSKNQVGKVRYHFSTQLKLQQKSINVPTYNSLDLQLDENLAWSRTSLYQNGAASLFHGSAFQGVEKILNASPEKLTMQCNLPSLGEREQGQFPVQTFNPYIVDVLVHSTWLWLQHFYQKPCLPSGIAKLEQFAVIPFDTTFYVSAEVKSKTETTVTTDIIAHDREGKIYYRMLGAKGTILLSALESN